MLKILSFLAVLLPFTALATEYTWPSPYQWPDVPQKPVRWIAYFTQKSCGPCVQEEKVEIPKLKKAGWAVKQWGEEGASFSVTDIAEHDDVADYYQVNSTPTFVLLERDPKTGKDVVLGIRSGYQTSEQIEKWYRSDKPKQGSARKPYPTRWNNWTGPDGRHQLGSREEAIQHLLFDGTHVGKFKRKQLERMSLSELRAIHSDDHENRVQWSVLNN